MVRQDRYKFRCRERNVQKKANAVSKPSFAKFVAQRNEMVIMDPKQIAWQDDLGKLVSKVLVDSQITREITPRELRQVDAVMQDRPQHTVGKAAIIFLMILFG